MRKCVFCGSVVDEGAYACKQCKRELPTETIALGTPLCYDHTCRACGETMTVYDTRFWQEIACSQCGKYFQANPPMSDRA